MDLRNRKTHDLQGAFHSALLASAFWEREWLAARDVARKLVTFREWDGVARQAAGIKAELARRGARDYDWTAPQSPRRLP